MKGFLSRLTKSASGLYSATLTPGLALAGSALLSYGVYLIYHPAAFIVGGVLVLGVAFDSSR